MLIPQFSLRWLLAVVTASSLVFLVLSLGARGQTWAIGASIGLLSLAVMLLVQGFCFFLVWVFASFRGRGRSKSVERGLLFLWGTLAACDAFAGGMVHQLPANNVSLQNGLRLAIDTEWVEGPGYRPTTLTISCAKPFPDDRVYSFDIGCQDWNPDNSLYSASVDLELPAGSTTASTTIAIPNFTLARNYSVDTWEDGRYVKELSKRSLQTGWNSRDQESPRLLFVSSATPDLTQLNTLFPESQYSRSQTQTGSGIPQDWHSLSAAQLPKDWLCYQSVDVLFISLADLKGLQTSSPEALDAIGKWTRAEGNLFVYGVGTDAANLAELDQLLGLAPKSSTSKEASHWQAPAATNYSDRFTDYQAPGQVVATADVDEHGNVIVPPVKTPPAGDPPFRYRTAQQGMVIAIAKDDPFDPAADLDVWYWKFNTLGNNRWQGEKRLGISSSYPNPDFWTFSIPGVGLAPVDTYRVLITLFVVAIGPVNYWWLRKRNRLHLLLFTVPASALVVTAALLGYALLADGLHTRTRSRSATLLDQRTGHAVTWARLAYYSGLAPSSGLRFSADTAAVPFEQRPYVNGGNKTLRTTKLSAAERHLARGWLNSRTPTQLMTIRPYVTKMALDVNEQNPTELTVTNRLGERIQKVLVRDRSGRYAYGADIASDATAKLSLISDDMMSSGSSGGDHDQVAEMQKVFRQNALEYPDGYSHEPNYGLFGLNRRYYYAQASAPVMQGSSRLETSLEFAKAAVDQAGIPGDSSALAPGSYIAIVDRPSDVPLGLQDTTELQGFHIIRGTW